MALRPGNLLFALALAAPASAQSWVRTETVTSPSVFTGNAFGAHVALDGDTLAVGAPEYSYGSGAGGVYERDLGGPAAWGEALFTVPFLYSSQFGSILDLDGTSFVVGPHNQTAWLYERTAPATWTLAQTVVPPSSVVFDGDGALDGDTLVVGAAGSKEVCVYERVGGQFALSARLPSPVVPFTYYGIAVDVCGDTIAVGAPREDRPFSAIYAYGMAFDPATGSLFGSSASLGTVFEIDTVGGEATPLGAGVLGLEGLAWAADTGTLYGVAQDDLYTIDRGTGAATLVGPTGKQKVKGLAYDAATATLYATEIFQDRLLTLDTTTGLATVVGPIGFASIRGLAFDPLTNRLFGSDRNADVLIELDTATGGGTLLGLVGEGCDSLAFDPVTSTLYGYASQLLTIDVQTGAATPRGGPYPEDGAVYLFERDEGGPGAWGQVARLTPSVPVALQEFGYSLALEGDTLVVGAHFADGAVQGSGAAYVFESGDGWSETARLLPSDGVSGAEFGHTVALTETTVVVGSPGYATGGGAAYVYARDAGGAGAWGEVQKLVTPGAVRLGRGIAITDGRIAVGDSSADGRFPGTGSVTLFEPAPPAVVYCTAGTSAAGCSAALSATGAPSASAPSGFRVDAAGVEGQKNGLFYYAANGRQAAPWGNGTSYQCVAPPVNRGGLLSGAGTAGACDGSFTLDLNARWCPTCPKPSHNPGAGAVARVQLWYRDPLNTSNQPTSLSDAVEATVLP